MYDTGRGVEQSDTQAVYWYRLSAEQGNSNAQDNLGWMYLNGRSVEQSDTQAVHWYRLSAEQGNSKAQVNLGWMYENGRGVEQSDTQAVHWYRLSTEQGNSNAQFNLGVMYRDGSGVEQSDTQAVHWFRLSAEQGDAHGQSGLGWMYVNGHGVTQSDVQAVHWFRLSSEQGNELARNYLDAMYESGRASLSANRVSFSANTMVPVNGVNIQAAAFPTVAPGVVSSMINPRVFADFIGGQVYWNVAARTATFTGRTTLGVETTVVLTLDSPVVSVNGQTFDIATLAGQPSLAGRICPVVIGGRSYVPVRVLAEIFNVPISFESGRFTLG
jgi:TPR repeat protein